ncbi:MAG: hypothetical protein KDN05_07700 [Verrucomicrobiae bacterium]|nr:hypothetical protein [Verrucomicrobiae bacterium]
MNKTLHLIRKDLRLCRWWLAVWTAVCGLHLGLRLYQLRFGDTVSDSGFWRPLETSDRWDWMVLRWLPLLIIPFFLHADPLVKRGAFWKGLPVRRSRLVTAKLAVVLAFFVLLPLVCEVFYFKTSGLSSILAEALGTWAWRFLPLVVIVTIACFATPGMLWGLPVAAGLYGVALISILRPDVSRNLVSRTLSGTEHGEFQILERAPEGLRIVVNDESAELTSITNSTVDPETKKPVHEEWTHIKLEVEAGSLPEGVLITRLDCHFDGLHFDHQIVVLDQTVRMGESAIPRLGEASIPLQEEGNPVNSGGLYDLENLRRTWVLSTASRMSARSIPIEGAELEGKVKASLVKRVTVKRIDYGDDAIWTSGEERLHFDWTSGRSDRSLEFSTGSYRPLAVDGRGNAAILTSNFWWPKGTTPWVRHKIRPYGRPLGSATPGMFRDVTRMRDLRFAGWSLSIDNALSPDLAPLARLRFRDEMSGPENWELEFVRYEPVGMLEIPFRVKVRRPQSLPVLEMVADDDLTSLPKPYASYLDDIQLPAEPTEEEARKAFLALTELCSGRWSEFGNVKWKVEEILAQVAADRPEILFEALGRHIRSDERERSKRNQRHRQNFVHYDFESSERLWKPMDDPVNGYWWHVRHALISTATKERKELYFRHLSPKIDLLPVIERFGWLEEAMPLMQGMAMHEPAPHNWREHFTVDAMKNGTKRSQDALERQIRAGAMEFYRVTDCMVSAKMDGERVANAAWDTTVERAVELSEVREAFMLALKYGIESAPRDLLRIMNTELLEDSGDSRSRRLLLLSMVQALSVHSDCPPDLAEAAKWLAENAYELSWNPVSRKYERPGGPAHEPFFKSSERYGQWIDPKGIGTLDIKDGVIRMSTRAKSTWVGNMIFQRDVARLMKPAEGDFTAEVTVEMPPAITATWGGKDWERAQCAGLLMEAGRYHYLLVQKKFFGTKPLSQIEVLNTTAVECANRQIETPAWDPMKPVTFRLCRYGDVFYSAWRQGAGDWIESEGFYNADWEDEVRVGPFLTTGVVKPMEAVFSGFDVRVGSTPPRHPPMGKFTTPEVVPTPDGAALETWGTVRNPLRNGVFRVDGDKLTILAAHRDSTWSSGSRIGAPAVLRRVTGEFTYEVTAGPAPSDEGAAWSSAVVVVCTRDKSASYKIGNGVFEPGKLLVNQRHWNRSYPRDNFHIPIVIDSSKPLRVRFERGAHVLRVSLREEGVEAWTQIGELLMYDWPDELEVGVAGVNAGPVDTLLEFRKPTLRSGQSSVSR